MMAVNDLVDPQESKKATLSDIAADAGVSMATVSRVLNQSGTVRESTVAKVMESVHKLNYEIQPAPASKGTAVGIILVCLPSIENPFYHDVVKGIKTAAMQHGYEVLIHEGHVNAATLRSLQGKIKLTRAVGLIVCNQVPEDVLQSLSTLLPVMQCCEFNPSVNLSYVAVDDVKSSIRVIDYLYSLGRKRIALLNGPEDYRYSQNRLQGYRQGLERCGLPFDPSMVLSVPAVQYNLGISSALHLLKAHQRPDAIFAASDVFAISTLRAAYQLGIDVPHDLAVVGVDNTQISAAAVPSLTTINMPRIQLGFVACEVLCELIVTPNMPVKQVVLDTEMIVREST